MHFELDSDQQQLQDSLRRLLDDQAAFAQRRQAAAGEPGWNPQLWRQLAELGVIALTLPEAHGGFGAAPIACLPVLSELGRVLALEPYLATAVLAATAIARAGNEAQQAQLLPGIAGGETVCAWAHDEPAARHAPLWVETQAIRDGQGWTLSGRKHNVLHGASASWLIVSARTSGAASDEGGLALFLVRPDAPGVKIASLRLLDDTPAAEIAFAGAEAQLLGAAANAGAALVAAQEAGLAAACAEAAGVAERAYALTVDYVQTRQQFGRAIGANQAVRHRVAEMRVALEMVRSAAMTALLALEEPDAAQRAVELSRAKMLAGRHGTFIVQQGIQLHGGIGMTRETMVGHCLRRLTVLDQLFGDGHAHAARLGRRFVATDDARPLHAA
jgi:pimeloyl-CoA dehydrogenase